jgi:hypothetical protein
VLGCEHHEFPTEQQKEFEDNSICGLIRVFTILPAIFAEPSDTYDMKNFKGVGSTLDSKSSDRTFSGSRSTEINITF